MSMIFIASCGEPSFQPKAMLEENLECPDGSIAQIERWGGVGENGWSYSCKKRHGKFTVWLGESKVIEGFFVEGKEHGTWTYWDKNGNKTKAIEYNQGKVLSENRF